MLSNYSGNTYEDARRTHTNGHSRASSLMDGLRTIADDLLGLVGEVTSLGSLRLKMIRTEMQEGAGVYKKAMILCSVALALGVLGAVTLTIALVCIIASAMPYSTLVSIACGAALVFTVYGILAWILARIALRLFKETSITPRRSVGELQRDIKTLLAGRGK